MQTKNTNVTQDVAESAQEKGSPEGGQEIPRSPPPPLPPRLSRPKEIRQCETAKEEVTQERSNNDPSAYAPYKRVPLPKPYPPPYRMPPIPPPVYHKYGSEPYLPGTISGDSSTPQNYSGKYPPLIQREINISQNEKDERRMDGSNLAIPSLSDISRIQRPRTASAVVAPEPGPPPPRCQVWTEDHQNAIKNIPVQQRIRTLLNHSPVNSASKQNDKRKIIEGEPLLPSSRRAISYPDGISNPGLDDNEGYVPSHPHQRKEGPRGQLILERQPSKFPLHESNPNLYGHSLTKNDSSDNLNGVKSSNPNSEWSSSVYSEDNHNSNLRNICLKLYPRNVSAPPTGSPSHYPEFREKSSDHVFKSTSDQESHDKSKLSQTRKSHEYLPNQQYYYLKDVYTGESERNLANQTKPENIYVKDHDPTPSNRKVERSDGLSYKSQECYEDPPGGKFSKEGEKEGTNSFENYNSTSYELAESNVNFSTPVSTPNGNGCDDQEAQGFKSSSTSFLHKEDDSSFRISLPSENGESLKDAVDVRNMMTKFSNSSSHNNYQSDTEWKMQKNLFDGTDQKDSYDTKKWNAKESLLSGITKKLPEYEIRQEDTSAQKLKLSSNGIQNGHFSAGSSDQERNTHCSNHSQDNATTSESGRGTMPSMLPSSNKSSSLSGALDSSLDSDINASQRNQQELEWTDISEKEFQSLMHIQGNIPLQPRNLDSTISDSLSVTPPLPSLTPTQSHSDSPIPPSGQSKYKLSSSNPVTSKSHHIVPDILELPRNGWQTSEKKLMTRPTVSILPDTSRNWNSQYLSTSTNRKNHVGRSNHSHSKSSRIPVLPNSNLTNIHEGMDGDITSTTTGLDMESLLDDASASSDSSDRGSSPGSDVQELRRQLEGLENMYSEVLKLLGIKSRGSMNAHRSLAEMKPKRKVHGSLSSLTGKGYSSSASKSHGIKDRRYPQDKKKLREGRGTSKRFQRLESHVVTLARSVAHLSSEMRTQHIMFQEIENLRREVGQIRDFQMALRMQQNVSNRSNTKTGLNEWENFRSTIPSLTNPTRIKKLAKFFGDEPPLLRLFLKKLGYEKYASNFEAEKIGMIELPYLTEERLQKIGIPMGPRMRILQEAQMSFRQEHFNIYIV